MCSSICFVAFFMGAALGCRGKSTSGTAAEIDCDSFTEDDFAYYFAQDYSCIDSRFCQPDGEWEQCTDDVASNTTVTDFESPDDSWNRDSACACAKSWEKSRGVAEAGLVEWECDTSHYQGIYDDCPDDWYRFVQYNDGGVEDGRWGQE